LKLNIGCGDLPAPEPWINVDTTPGPTVDPDVVADARDLPYDDGTVEAIFCGHVLEHLEYGQAAPAALRELCRVLAPNGRIAVVGPDYERAKAWNDDVLLQCIRDGGDRWGNDRHLWLPTLPATLDLVRIVFPNAHEVPMTELDPYWPVAFRVEWQLAIEATRT
jgi:SAM-dependent methyltransferase